MPGFSFIPVLPRNLLEAAKLMASLLEKAEERDNPPSRSKHPAWEYFARLDRSNAICLLCRVTVRSACSTNLARHIGKHHPLTAHEMKKAWLAGRGVVATVAAAAAAAAAGSVGVSASASPSAAIAATSADCEKRMNCDSADPSYPLLVNPYSSAMMGNTLGQPLLTVGLSDITGGCSWLPYQDLRTLDGTTAYETELTLGCPDLSSVPKYETVKYEYSEIQSPEKTFDSEPRLYHKEEIKVDEETEKDEKSSNGDSTPVKRGRPTENPCWNYFFRLDDQNVRCKLCSKVVKSACATNMTKHLERHHQHDYQHLIVQIRQYRSSKGPMLPTSSEIAHILPNNYVKTEPYPDIYSTSPADAELSVYPQTSYERALQDSSIWSRQPWNQWHTGQPLETTIDTRSNGVIITHGNSQSWASTSSSSSSGGGGGPEKPYMKRNRKTEHPVWEYFKRTQDGNAQCAICAGVVKSPCSSNFMRHLMRHHSTEYNNVYIKWIQKRGPGGGGPPPAAVATVTTTGK